MPAPFLVPVQPTLHLCCEASGKPTFPGEGCNKERLPPARPTVLLGLEAGPRDRPSSGSRGRDACEQGDHRCLKNAAADGSLPPREVGQSTFSATSVLCVCVSQVPTGTMASAEKQKTHHPLKFYSSRLKRKRRNYLDFCRPKLCGQVEALLRFLFMEVLTSVLVCVFSHSSRPNIH